MENSEVKRKKDKLKELHDLEKEINKEIMICEKKSKSYFNKIKLEAQKKQKLVKRVSHNMKLRNVIIKELIIMKYEK